MGVLYMVNNKWNKGIEKGKIILIWGGGIWAKAEDDKNYFGSLGGKEAVVLEKTFRLS